MIRFGKETSLTPSRPSAFTLVEVMIVVAIIGILLVIAVPGWIRYRTISQARACQQNLRIIDNAKEMVALADGLDDGATVTWNDLYTPGDRTKSYLDHGIPFCPGGGTYTLNPIGTLPECSVGKVDILDGTATLQHRFVGSTTGGTGS